MKPKQPAPQFLAWPPPQPPSLGAHPDDIRRHAEIVAATATLRDEPEKVGPRWLKDWADVAQLHKSQQHAKDVAEAQHLRPLLTAEDRIKDIRRRAKFANIDLSNECHIMQRDLDRAKAGNRKPPKRVLERCEGLETLLDGVDTRAAA